MKATTVPLVQPAHAAPAIEPLVTEVAVSRTLRLPEGTKPLISELEIRYRTARMAAEIASDYRDRPLVIVAVLKGSFVFAADLMRRLYEQFLTPDLDFIRAASYGDGDRSSGKVSLQLDVSLALSGKDVLLVDDIADSGLTLSHLVAHLRCKGVASLKTCVLLDKPSRRETSFTPDYIGFTIPNLFVVGYGIDFAEHYRYLPYIASLESS